LQSVAIFKIYPIFVLVKHHLTIDNYLNQPASGSRYMRKSNHNTACSWPYLAVARQCTFILFTQSFPFHQHQRYHGSIPDSYPILFAIGNWLWPPGRHEGG